MDIKCLTKAHSTKSRQNGQQYNPPGAAFQRKSEYRETENQYERCLAAHDQELCGHMREKYFDAGNTAHKTSLQHTLVALNQHSSGGQSDRQEKDDCQDNAWCSEIGEVWCLKTVNGFLPSNGYTPKRRIQVARCQNFVDKIEIGVLNVTE